MSGGRVTIPNNVRKMIQNIKEITGNHSEDEIYTMLKECSMDPNETAQKLLLQDPFHEVRRKRDRKKENLTKEPIEPRWKPGMQGRGNRGNRGNYSSRHISNDAGGGRTTPSAKENGIIKQGAEEGAKLSIAQGQKSKEMSVETDKKQPEVTLSTSSSSKLEGPLPKVPPFEASKIPTAALHGSSKNMEASKAPSPSPGVYLSEKDPILMPSQDSRLPVGTIRREVGSQRTLVDQSQETPLEIKSTAPASEVGSSSMQGKAPSSHVPFSIARPSSNYNNRLQQAIGPQKVGPSMEWKPKPTNPILGQGTGSNEGGATEPPNPNLEPKDTNHELEKKLKDSHISDDEHVIIPNHLHVPEAEKLGFCFGSFDASFGLHNKTSSNGPVSDKTSSQVDERITEAHSRSESALPTPDGEEDNPERPTSSENLETEGDMSSTAGPKQDSSPLPTPAHQPPPVHTSPNFSFGFMPPPMIGTQQLASFENNDPQPRDGSHIPSFVVQQAFDPASYYGQFYRETDGRIAVPTKYNPAPTLSSPPSQSSQSQEVGKSVMISRSTSPASATGVSEEVLRQPHYPPNYIPYAPYFSPFYVPPPPAFLSNATFPLPAAKYPVAQHQYKPAAGHIGMPYANEDLAASHFKQTNLYITGHQSEGPGVWIAGPGRDMSGLQASSFYNLPQVPYTPNHASFAPNIYHHPPQPQPATTPLPGPAGDMVGPTPTAYHQQPQPTQINWPNNY